MIMRHHYSHCTAMQVNWVCEGWEREALKTCISLSVKLIYIVNVSTGHHWWCPVSSPGPPTPWSTPRAASPLDTWHVTRTLHHDTWHVTCDNMKRRLPFSVELQPTPKETSPTSSALPSTILHINTHREGKCLLSHYLSHHPWRKW